MEQEVNLSKFVENVDEVEIGQWYVKEGEMFSPEDIVLEVISNKAVLEVAFGFSGKLISILHQDGEIVSISDTIATIETTN